MLVNDLSGCFCLKQQESLVLVMDCADSAIMQQPSSAIKADAQHANMH